MKKQKTLKLNIDLPYKNMESHPNVNLDTIPLDDSNRKSLEVQCSNGAYVNITEFKGSVYIDINEHNLKREELVTLDEYENYIVKKEESHTNKAYKVKRVQASTKTTEVNFNTYTK